MNLLYRYITQGWVEADHPAKPVRGPGTLEGNQGAGESVRRIDHVITRAGQIRDPEPAA
ncbi:hypothetical protein ACIBF5_13240 [Micromonospora sp. NPDC050417]|uniref:hypothetical protein n=1 Tax=Micromonospora sp. NPDC050417 TaxID=3364280 RepID=UPI0037A9C3B6